MEHIVEIDRVSMRFRLEQNKIKSLKGFLVAAARQDIRYEEFRALEDVSFGVKRGEVVGIIGRNGAGKSTLLKIIAGIMKPTSGTVTVRGNIVPMLELGSGFDFELTGRENIFLNGAILGYSKEYLKSKFDEIVSFSELDKFIDTPIRSYSSGMMMRLAFSIATVVNPEILIVDEILAVGDAQFQEKSRARMMEMMGGGTTVFFVSHNLSQIEDMCNRVVWLEHGRIQMIGAAKEVCEMYGTMDVGAVQNKNDGIDDLLNEDSVHRDLCFFGKKISLLSKQKLWDVYGRCKKELLRMQKQLEMQKEQMEKYKEELQVEKDRADEAVSRKEREIEVLREEKEREAARLCSEKAGEMELLRKEKEQAAQTLQREKDLEIQMLQEQAGQLNEAVRSKENYRSDQWCTGWIEHWKSYYHSHYDDIDKRVEKIKENVDEVSRKTIDLLLERNFHTFPVQKYTNCFLYNYDEIYEDWEHQGMRQELPNESIWEKYKIDPGTYLEVPVFRFHCGLQCLPKQVTERLRGTDIIDGGAFWGDSALVFSEYGPNSIHAFEPMEQNYKKLCEIKERNRMDHLMTVNCGLGRQTEKNVLHWYEMLSGASVINYRALSWEKKEEKSKDIDIVSIDDYVFQNQLHVGLIKLDIEGAELEAVQGALDTIYRDKPILLISVYHMPKDLFEIKPLIENLQVGYRFLFRKLVFHDPLTEVSLIAYVDKM